MYNFVEYISNYSDTSGSFGLYSEDDVINFNDNITDTDPFKSSKYKSESIRQTFV